VGSWNPVVMTSHGRVPRPVLMAGIALGIAGLLVGALVLGMGGSSDSKSAAGAGTLRRITTWDPPALALKPAGVTVTPADPSPSAGKDAPKKKKKPLIWHPNARRPAAPPTDKKPQGVSGRKIYTEL
jgi:hypothetical protein